MILHTKTKTKPKTLARVKLTTNISQQSKHRKMSAGIGATDYLARQSRHNLSPDIVPPRTVVPVLGAGLNLLTLNRRPLWKAETVCDYLDIVTQDFLRLIEDGGLAWAFDIGAVHNRARKEIRVLAHCAIERAHGSIKSIGPTANVNFSAMIELVLPHHRSTLRGVELQRMLSCAPNHVADLARCGAIERVRESIPTTGPLSSPRFTRESVIRFLEKRRML